MRSRRKIHFFLLLVFLSFIISACHKNSDEEQIRLSITALTKAVEQNVPGDIAEYLHPDFLANGELNAQQVKQMLAVYALQHKSISMTIVSSKTVIDPVYTDQAESTLSVITTATSGGILPGDGSMRVVKLTWRKDDDWKILKADWE